ncbi:MAG TPA: hypothetical protein VIV40_20155 [Kofleriaceae bacterium]
MKAWPVLAMFALAMLACSSTHGTGTGSGSMGSGVGSAPPVTTNAKSCDDVRPRVEQLYRAEGQAKEPKRVDDFVADNTAMVMKDCGKDPGKRVPCLAAAASVADLERQCLIQLDDEGTEGEALAK